MAQKDTARAPAKPSASMVLRKIADVVDTDDLVVDRIAIQKATDYEYPWRVYHGRGDDYTGGVLSFPAQS